MFPGVDGEEAVPGIPGEAGADLGEVPSIAAEGSHRIGVLSRPTPEDHPPLPLERGDDVRSPAAVRREGRLAQILPSLKVLKGDWSLRLPLSEEGKGEKKEEDGNQSGKKAPLPLLSPSLSSHFNLRNDSSVKSTTDRGFGKAGRTSPLREEPPGIARKHLSKDRVRLLWVCLFPRFPVPFSLIRPLRGPRRGAKKRRPTLSDTTGPLIRRRSFSTMAPSEPVHSLFWNGRRR